jgi:murein DD-endopeptidase MepM/ murein hydrolase activator NlpD
VGHTGDARACHLHFEMWRGGWYDGGRPLDPLPSLLSWDRWS